MTCPVALYTAASTAERIAFHILNRKTGHRVHREFVDVETGKLVDAKSQIKGYETGAGSYIAFEPEEIAKTVPEADKTLDNEAFVPCAQVDNVYFDQPHYLAPSSEAEAESFVLIRDGMAAAKVVAVARTVLFRCVRSVLDPCPWRRPDRAHAQFRLRGALSGRGVRRSARSQGG